MGCVLGERLRGLRREGAGDGLGVELSGVEVEGGCGSSVRPDVFKKEGEEGGLTCRVERI